MVGDILFAQICLQPPDVNIDTIALVSNIEKVNGIVLNKSENLFWQFDIWIKSVKYRKMELKEK